MTEPASKSPQFSVCISKGLNQLARILNWGIFASADLYKAINACLKPVKDDLAKVDVHVKEIMGQLDQIEKRVKALSEQLTNIEKAVAQKPKA